MLSASQTIKDAVYAPSRRIVGTVTFDITDVTAYDDVASIIATPTANFTDYTQINDRERNPDYKLATYEDNRFILDGTVSFPDSIAANNGETGFVSSSLCDNTGAFTSYPQITVNFNTTHSSAGITVTFDTQYGEYATDFDISAYDASGALITTASITGNTEVVHQALGQLYNYKKLVITIKKWSVPYRRARVLEIDYGIVKVYDGNSLISMGLSEEVDLTSGQVPSAEFNFVVDNSDRLFNILNPTGFYKYLQQRQRIYAQLGVELDSGSITYFPLGQYYLSEWRSDEGSLTTTFYGQTGLDLMASYNYENLTPSRIDLCSLAKNIFAICNITNYYIDSSLSSIFSNQGLVQKTDCKSVIQMIAIMGCVNVLVGRDGTIKLVKLDTIGASQDSITFDNVYSEPQIQLEKIVKNVEVPYYSDLNNSMVVSVSADSVTDGVTLSISDNTLIDSSLVATNVASWLLKQTNNRRAHYLINFRGNPLHEIGDVLDIENSYGTDSQAILTKNEISFQGYLSTTTEARGMAS